MRKLPSGRYQASYVGPDLKRHAAPYTFEAAIDAEGWLTQERRLVASDEPWTPPRVRFEALRAAAEGGMTLRHFAPEALARRRTRGKPLRPKTMSLYEGLLRRVIYPRFGDVPMRLVTDDDVNGWLDGLDPDTPTQNAHAYALLHGLFVDAVHPKQRARTGVTANPCSVKGAGTVRRRYEIRTAALVELDALLEHTPPRFRALVVVAFAWCGLRFGEAAELRRSDVDLETGVLHVRRAVVRVEGQNIVGPPKSAAGVRAVTVPPHVLPLLAAHMHEHVGPGASALLFPAEAGGTEHLAHATFYKYVWMPARAAAGRPDLRLHDLRHTAAVLSAQSGATVAELMGRYGHSSAGASLRYQHVAHGRDAEIAARMSRLAAGGT